MNLKEGKTEVFEVKSGMRIQISIDNCLQVWDIVGHPQNDNLRRLISCDTPLVQLIWGMKEGEEIKGQFGNRELDIKIIKISKTPKKERIF